MAEKEISLLKGQISRLDEKNFDLEAWKKRTIIFLTHIYGKESSKIKMIKDLHYDYSSWNLRDTFAGGSANTQDPVKLQSKEILGAIITELETLGLPEKKHENLKIIELLQDELTGRQMKDLDTILNSNDPEKIEKIKKIIEIIPHDKLVTIITGILIS